MASPRLARSVIAVALSASSAFALTSASAVTPTPSASPTPSPTATATASPETLARFTARVHQAMKGTTAAHVDYEIQVDGVGTIARSPTRLSAPASNEKLLTSLTLLNLVGPTYRYATTVSGTANLGSDGTLDGDLVLTGSGDPTLTRRDLGAIAHSLANVGLSHVTGRLIVDDTRYSHTTIAPGWKRDFVPEESGTVDAFTVNNNDWRSGTAFDADPTRANAGLWRTALRRAGITVAGPTVVGRSPSTLVPLWTHQSRPLSAIVEMTLNESINFYAEMMLREAGYQRSGHGSLATGTAAVRAEAAALHIPIGTVNDGSGLSYADRQSPSTFTALLDELPTQPKAYQTIFDGMPRSCTPPGTLENRLCGRFHGLVRAKTGTLDRISSLSGYTITDGERGVVFSFLLSGIRNVYTANARIDATLRALINTTA
ncbi:MAG TPA: D-alanyl-D-alanine carboxypeptidase [Mycobacteriales bacterium]|nr:D-alanyl-D-alanine carboxypeptidase [Mycobacteriales bacterium]